MAYPHKEMNIHGYYAYYREVSYFESRTKRFLKKAAYSTGIFLGFLGIFFAGSPNPSINNPLTARSGGVTVAHAETPVISSYTLGTTSVGGDDDCGGDAGDDGDDGG